jgi:hypothetical protein
MTKQLQNILAQLDGANVLLNGEAIDGDTVGNAFYNESDDSMSPVSIDYSGNSLFFDEAALNDYALDDDGRLILTDTEGQEYAITLLTETVFTR